MKKCQKAILLLSITVLCFGVIPANSFGSSLKNGMHLNSDSNPVTDFIVSGIIDGMKILIDVLLPDGIEKDRALGRLNDLQKSLGNTAATTVLLEVQATAEKITLPKHHKALPKWNATLERIAALLQ